MQHVFRDANSSPRHSDAGSPITHRFSLADSAKAFDAMRDPAARVIKAQIILDA